MYTARFQLGEGRSIFQALVYLPQLVLEGAEGEWNDVYRSFVESLLNARLDFAYRITDFGGRVGRYFLITASTRDAVLELARTAERLNLLSPRSAIVPADKSEHDIYAARFPPVRRTICREPYFAGSFEVPCDFYAIPLTSQLLRTALSSRSNFGLQINCHPFSVSQDELRSVRKRLVDLRLAGGAPEKVVSYVSRHVDELASRTFLVEECIGTDHAPSLNGFADVMDSAYQQLQSPLGFTGSSLGPPPAEEEVTVGLHSCYMDSPPRLNDLWRALMPADLQSAIAWIPDVAFADLGVTNAIRPVVVIDFLAQILSALAEIESKIGVPAPGGPAARLRGAIQMSKTDYLGAAGVARSIVEEIVRKVFLANFPTETKKANILDNMIERIRPVVPATVFTNMHSVRIVGNIGVHGTQKLDRSDIDTCMMQALKVIEWYLLTYLPAQPRQ